MHVWVRARALDGQANAAVERKIAEALGLRTRQVRVVGGARSRHKSIEVEVGSLEELCDRLARFNRA